MTVSIGDHVMDATGTKDGELVAIDGGTGYVLQGNGVEVEFPLARLRPYQAPKVPVQKVMSGPLRDTVLSPAHAALLASVPGDVMAAIAKSYEAGDAAGAARPVFAALADSKKLEIVRIYLPSLPQALLLRHMKLVVAMRDLAKAGR